MVHNSRYFRADLLAWSAMNQYPPHQKLMQIIDYVEDGPQSKTFAIISTKHSPGISAAAALIQTVVPLFPVSSLPGSGIFCG